MRTARTETVTTVASSVTASTSKTTPSLMWIAMTTRIVAMPMRIVPRRE